MERWIGIGAVALGLLACHPALLVAQRHRPLPSAVRESRSTNLEQGGGSSWAPGSVSQRSSSQSNYGSPVSYGNPASHGSPASLWGKAGSRWPDTPPIDDRGSSTIYLAQGAQLPGDDYDQPAAPREQVAAPPTPLDVAASMVPATRVSSFGRPGHSAPPNVGYPPPRSAAGGTANAAVPFAVPQQKTPAIPDPSNPALERNAARKTSGLMLGLLFSVALNLFLAWITWDTHNRYQDLIDDLDELEARRMETARPEITGRHVSGRRRARDYEGVHAEASGEIG